MKCAEKGHRFQKFDDESLFCERCGERRVIAPAIPSWTPDWTYRPQWWWPNTWSPPYWPPYIVTSDSMTSVFDYQVWSGSGPSGTIQTNAITGPQTQTPRGVKRT